MSVVGINFGSATSGAGFDVATTVNSIMANARAPETAWDARTTALKAQDTALSTLGTDMSVLSSALATLTAFDGSFSQKNGAVSDPSAVALTDASTDASAGTHTLTVQRLATTSQQHSSAVASGTTLSGSFKFQVGTGSVQSITLDGTNNTIAGLASAINQLGAGVIATVLTDSSGSRLSLTSSSSGAASEITANSSGLSDSSGNAVSLQETQAGADAAYTIDGVALTSASNTVSNALPGVTFQLLKKTTSDVSLQISNDTAGIASALSNFVTAYNALSTALAAQEGKDTSGVALPLYGDQTLSFIQSRLSSSLAFATANTGSSSNLAQLGLSVDTTGKLTLDSSVLGKTLASNFAGATNFFQNAGDFGQNLTTVLNGLGSLGDGALALRASQNAAEEKTLSDNKSNLLELRLVTYQAHLTEQLSEANQILQSIPSQLNEMKLIYAAITGYNGN